MRLIQLPQYVRITLLAAMMIAPATMPTTTLADFGRTGGAVESTGLDGESLPLRDPVTLLENQLADGKAKLEWSDSHGYLKSVLAQLKVPHESQLLVFSQTSLQRRKISPATPRAFYFNDDVYVGWVQGGEVLEVISMDPTRGAIFYALKQERVNKPTIVANDANCLACHQNGRTLGVPGPVVRSLYTDPRGRPVLTMGTFDPDHTTALNKRWGGYYITGKHGSMQHMGNTYVTDVAEETFDRSLGANVTDLSKHFNTKPYLNEHSDIVAMLVLDHQVYMHNVLTRANFEGRSALHYQKTMAKMLEQPEDKLLESVERRLNNAADNVVEALLFAGEPQFTSPVQGTSKYPHVFEAMGKKDKQGRSLRQFDLNKRIFKHPCSFLIHNAAFDMMPKPVLDRTYAKLHAVLTGTDDDKADIEKYKHLTAEDRQAIMEILLATKKSLPESWRK